MRIGLVLPDLPAYSETFFRNKILGLQRNGIEVVLFVNTCKVPNTHMGCKVYSAPKLHGGLLLILLNSIGLFFRALFINPKRSFRLFVYSKQGGIGLKQNIKQIIANQFLLSKQVDWLHFGFGTMALGREDIARVIGAKMAVSFRGYDIAFYPVKNPGCYKQVWRRADKIHVISNRIKTLLYNEGFNDECSVVKITPAIDTSFFVSSIDRMKTKNHHIVTVARLHKVKGIHYVLEALAMLKKDGVDFHYTIIGSGTEENTLRNLAIRLGIMDCVTFTGKLAPEAVREHLKNASVYVQYSEHEGFCNAVLEAQAMGVLPIVSNVGGLPENVINGRTGWVVDKQNPKQLMKAIKSVIDINENEEKIFRERAIKRVQGEFNLEKQNMEFLDFYEISHDN